MARVVRLLDLSRCKCGCFGYVVTGASTVRTNQRHTAATVISYVMYPCACKLGVVYLASPNVFVEGKNRLARINDYVKTKCGLAPLVTGSPNVNSGWS